MIYDAFRLHDQDGLRLSMQQDMATASGVAINYAAFACDALGAGWPEERVASTIKEARGDIEWPAFRERLAWLWVAAGRKPDPECWAAMKDYIVGTEGRYVR